MSPEGLVSPIAERPLRDTALDGASRAWRVAEGWVDLFAELVDEDGAATRRHLLRAEAGTLLVGTEAASRHRLLAVPGLEGRLVPESAPDAAALRGWIEAMHRALPGPGAWPDEVLTPGLLRLEPGRRAAPPPHALAWVEVVEGVARLDRGAMLPAGTVLPLALPCSLEAEGGSCLLRVAPEPGDEATVRQLVDAQTARLLTLLARHHAEDRAARARRAAQGDAVARAGMSGALRMLARIAGGAASGPVPRGADPLRLALELCLAALGHPTPLPEAGGDPRAEGDTARLARLVALAGAEWRPVTLGEGWWRQDGMAMLAWWGEERRPVALLREGSGRWRARGEGIDVMIDGRGAAGLARDAVQLYPALPHRPLRLREVAAWAARGLGRDFGRVAGMGLLAAVLGLGIPAATGLLFDTVVPLGDRHGLVQVICGLVAAAFGATAFGLVQTLAVLRIESRMDARLQAALFQRLLRLPIAFFRGYTVGELTDRTLGVQAAREELTGATFSALLGAVFSFASLGLMVVKDWRLALVGGGIVLAITVVLGTLSYLQLRQERHRARESALLEGFVLQILGAIGKLRAAAAEPRAMAEWARRAVAGRRAGFAAARWAAWRGAAAACLPTLGLVAIYAVSVYFAKEDARQAALDALAPVPGKTPREAMTAGAFVAFAAAFGALAAAITEAATALTRALATLPLIERVQPILAAVPETQAALDPQRIEGGIELRRIRFRYHEGAPEVLRDLSLSIRPGEYVALVGGSGSGKSTVLRMILGFERPQSGEVWFDGCPADRMDLGAMRRSIGVVMQSGRIGAGPLHEAIAAGSAASLEACWAAARLVGLAGDIEAMPMGMHTALPDGGGTLSGGQRQRVLLARALVRRPRILLLDEATSALDNRTQAVVTQTLATLPITRIVVAHRLSTVQAVDRVLVLEGGRLVEEGPPAELLGRDGAFARLARRQML